VQKKIHRAKDSIHHRKCRSNGGDNSQRNLSCVNGKAHQAWHMLFRNWKAEQIAEEINKVWLDPDFRFLVVKS